MKMRTFSQHPVLVSPGAVLASSALRPDGVVLLAAGTVLDADKLAHLHQRGVDLVFIAKEDDRDPAVIAADIAAASARVEAIFSGESGDMRNDLQHAIMSYRRNQVA